MTAAAALALLLAQATALPSPTPNAGDEQRATLSFADGLRRLINDGSNAVSQDLVFARDLGPRIGGSYNTYALKFAIAGLTDCHVTSNGYDAGYVACTAYQGPEATLARTAFSRLLKQLQDFAGSNSVSVLENPPHVGLHVGKETWAGYFPNDRVRVFINLLESTSKGFPSTASFVVSHVPANKTPAPTPSVNSCPTKGVLRITSSGLVPSAGNPKNAPPPTTGPQVQTTNDWVMILVDVNADGSVKGVRLLHSAGPAIDRRFLHEARTSHYQPKMIDRRAVEGIYYFFVPIGNT